MKQWQLVAKKALKMNSATPSESRLQDGAIKIKIEKVMLTSDDVLLYAGAIPVTYPFIPGSYAVGKVSEVAKNVSSYTRSMRVVMRGTQFIDGEGAVFLGRNRPGFMRDFITVTCNDFYPLPSSITDEEALFVGLIAQAEAVIAKLSPERGDVVAVMGGSCLAIIICQLLLIRKVIPVYIDADDGRRAIARKNGVFYTLKPEDELTESVTEITGGRMCGGGIYSFTGNSTPVGDIFRLVSYGSAVIFTGDSSRPVNLSLYDITHKDLKLCGVYSGLGYELSALNSIINKAINLTNYKRRTSPDSALPEVFERLCNPSNNENVFEIISF